MVFALFVQGGERKKTRWNSDKAQEMFEPDNKLPLFRGAGEREQKKGAEDQLKPTSALCSWAGFFFLLVIVWAFFVLLRCLVIILFALGPVCAAF